MKRGRGRPKLERACTTGSCRNKAQPFSDYCENCIISRRDVIENREEHPLSDALDSLADDSQVSWAIPTKRARRE